MLKQENDQLDIYSSLLENLVKPDHAYRKVLTIVDFKSLCKPLHVCYSQEEGIEGYPVETAFKCLLLQQWEDLSDRQMERFLQENNAGKLFCGFGLMEYTPDHSFFGKARKRFGVDKIVELHNQVISQLKAQRVVSEVFTFVDSTAVISKLSIWEERDKKLQEMTPDRLKAIEKNIPSVNITGNLKECTTKEEIKITNKNISNYAIDKDARIGNKGKNKFWYGYKRHISVDGKSGIITKVEVTPANVLDHDERVLDKLLPAQGMVLADRGYDTNKVLNKVIEKDLHSGIRLRKIRKYRDPDKERWFSSIRSPFEGVFRHADKITPYIGFQKVKLHQMLDSFVQNLKRLVVINETPVFGAIKIS